MIPADCSSSGFAGEGLAVFALFRAGKKNLPLLCGVALFLGLAAGAVCDARAAVSMQTGDDPPMTLDGPAGLSDEGMRTEPRPEDPSQEPADVGVTVEPWIGGGPWHWRQAGPVPMPPPLPGPHPGPGPHPVPIPPAPHGPDPRPMPIPPPHPGAGPHPGMSPRPGEGPHPGMSPRPGYGPNPGYEGYRQAPPSPPPFRGGQFFFRR